jgi:hypothetical protein
VSEERKATHLYTLKPGDTWKFFKHYLVIANPDHSPFMVDVFTGEQKEIDPSCPPSPITNPPPSSNS